MISNWTHLRYLISSEILDPEILDLIWFRIKFQQSTQVATPRPPLLIRIRFYIVYRTRPISLAHWKVGAGCRKSERGSRVRVYMQVCVCKWIRLNVKYMCYILGQADVISMHEVLTNQILLRFQLVVTREYTCSLSRWGRFSTILLQVREIGLAWIG